MTGGSSVSLNLRDLFVAHETKEANFRAVTESEVIGLAVQLLKAKGAVEKWWCVVLDKSSEPRLCGREQPEKPSSHTECGIRLVVPLSILGDEK